MALLPCKQAPAAGLASSAGLVSPRVIGTRPHARLRRDVGSVVAHASPASLCAPARMAGVPNSRPAGRAPVVRAATAAPPHAAVGGVEAALTSAAPGSVVRLFRSPGLSASARAGLLSRVRKELGDDIHDVDAEACFNIQVERALTPPEARTLAWLLRETFEPELLTAESRFGDRAGDALVATSVVEVGPRLSYTTPWSANVRSICESCGLSAVTRIEQSRRYAVTAEARAPDAARAAAVAALVHDRMTEQRYEAPLASFQAPGESSEPAAVTRVPVLAEGRAALERANSELGLAFDERDLDYYCKMFGETLGRDPTDVELFDLAQSNSEHSRHWFFGGEITVDGVKCSETLMQVVKSTLKTSNANSVVAFADNSSAVRGGLARTTVPSTPGAPGPLAVVRQDLDVLLTAETHNFPCAVAPRPGAETGAGGRMRDTHATGRGSLMGAATAGYCVGNLLLGSDENIALDSYLAAGCTQTPVAEACTPTAYADQPWEDASFAYPPTLAHPREVLTEASNGASDYGNKFGEPLIAGFTRAFGLRTPDGARREWVKPIMFSAGLGSIDHGQLVKDEPQLGWHVVKLGGPAYRIGMGGGAASSLPSGALSADLDFNAVQRGDAEVAQKLWRVVRACVELGDANPLRSIHDQGAGGNCNVVKEIIYPLGAEVRVRDVALGDASMSVLEIWGAEYQENDCVLVRPEDLPTLRHLAERERCGLSVIGEIDGSGKIVLVDSKAPADEPHAVDLDLELVLGDMPRKRYDLSRRAKGGRGAPLVVPDGDAASVARSSLRRVLTLPSVSSKRYLTNKVDRCVTGLVAQQQAVGPLATPLADVGVMAASHWSHRGAATAIGEQPIKGLLDPEAMARLALAEALTNLTFAPITGLADVKASVNWMYSAAAEGEGADIWDAAQALREAMAATGVAVDGGKDSLSMAAGAGGETVVAPGNMVVSAYAVCEDVTRVVTPDLRDVAAALVHVDLASAPGARRLGGSALAQAYGQIGDISPDVDVPALKAAFEVTQRLVRDDTLLAGHDVSDGGLATAILEMAFAGNVGVVCDLPAAAGAGEPLATLAALFAEEPGLVLQVPEGKVSEVIAAYEAAGARAARVGSSVPRADSPIPGEPRATLAVAGSETISERLADLRNEWEATSWALEARQTAAEAVKSERKAIENPRVPTWNLPYAPAFSPEDVLSAGDKPKVVVLREEGSNGDREMASVLLAAGLEPWDVTMSDLAAGKVDLSAFQGVVFPGGFSYADVLDSAKGWAGSIRFNDRVRAQLDAFRARPDTFSLGVCNGCQLMALLGWVPGSDLLGVDAGAQDAPRSLPDAQQPRFVHNSSGRFECRWSHVEVDPDTPAVLLKGMGGARMGVWVAHGEGKAHFPDPAVREAVLAQHLAPIRYVDADGALASSYPDNPNGSDSAVAALCSPDGRHLALMPHPERCYMMWQNPWWPSEMGLSARDASPWLKLFQNAREWAVANRVAA